MKTENYYVFDVTPYGDVQLTEHFKANEFKCEDNSRVIILDPDLLATLEDIRSHFNKPVIINSGYRTVSYNSTLTNASPNSQHILGKAADIRIKGVQPIDVYNYVCSKYPSTGGFGIYNSFVHVDCREKKSRWDYRTNK